MLMIFYAGTTILAAAVAALIIVVEHYFPWRMLIGRSPAPLACYALGLLAILLPYSVLVGAWSLVANTPLYLTALALWVVAAASGLSTAACHLLDLILLHRARAIDAEAREAALLERLQAGTYAPTHD